MSHDNHGDKRGAHTIHAKGGGGGGKWLLGALAAVVLAGGGYYVWKNMSPAQPNADYAYNANIPSDDATRATPYDNKPADAADENLDAQPAATESAAPASTASAPARRTTASSSSVRASNAAYVPEETVGVTPASAIVNNEDEIIVQGDRRPQWTRTPTAFRLSAAYPERALERGREGEASVHCIVQENGSLGCERVSEYPANSGFGTAALRVARMYRHAPARWDGSSAAGTPVNLRVMFRMAEEERHASR